MLKVYKSEFCNNCGIITQYLKNNNVQFEEIYITDEISKELAKNGFKMLPVLEVNGELTANVSKENLDKIIESEKNNG